MIVSISLHVYIYGDAKNEYTHPTTLEVHEINEIDDIKLKGQNRRHRLPSNFIKELVPTYSRKYWENSTKSHSLAFLAQAILPKIILQIMQLWCQLKNSANFVT